MHQVTASSITFNIVYTPGTVRYLKIALFSLMDRSDFRFRLVGNGLGQQEARELRALAATDSRLEVFFFSSPQMLPHGVVLSLLFRRFDDGAYFAFCDPDIFAVGPFQEHVLRALARGDVFSSCYHVGLKGEVVEGGFVGRCLYGPRRLPLATTFFAVYRRAAVERVWRAWGIGFERYLFAEYVPEHVKQALEHTGLFLPPFDTGKLLNVLMNLEGLRLYYEDLAGLCHIGGICRALEPRRDWRIQLRVEPLRLFARRCVITDRRLRRLQRLYEQAGGRPGRRSAEAARLLALRTCIAEYFAAYLKHLVDGAPAPVMRLHQRKLQRRLELMCRVIRAAYERFSGPARRASRMQRWRRAA